MSAPHEAVAANELFVPMQETELVYSAICMFDKASVEHWLFSDIKRLRGLDAKGRRMVSWRRKL